MLRLNASLLRLQEVDRLEKLLPVLARSGYSHHYASGPGKKHGCLIAFKADRYSKVDETLVEYDEQDVCLLESQTTSRRASTFRTRNIGSIVALKETANDNHVVIGTTHLFWHPRYHFILITLP